MDTHPRAHETHSSSYKKQAMDPTIPKPTTTMDDPGLVHDGAAATATTPPLEEAEAEPNRIPVVPVQSTDPNHPHNDNTTTNNTTNNTATVVEVTRVVSATDIGLAVVDPFALVTVVVEASSSSSVPASSASSSSSVAAAAAATESVVSETNATTTAVDDNYNTNSDDTEEDDATESEEEASSFLGCERLLGAREPNENGSVAVNSCMEEASASSQHPPEPTATVAAATTTTAVDDENEYDDTAPPIPLSTTNATIATIATREDGGAVEVEGAGEETAAVEETVDVSSSPPPPHAAAEPASLVAPPPPTAVSTSTTPVQDETLEPEETLPPPARGVIRMEEVGGDGKNSVEATTTSDPPPPLPGVGEPHLPPSPPQSEPALPPLLRNAINIAIIQETRKEHPLLEVGVAEEEGTGGETAAVEEEEDAASKQPPLSGTEPAPVPPVEEDAPVGNSMEVSSSDQPPLSGVEPELRPVANILPPHAERAPAAPLQKEATATTPVDETVKKDTDTSGRGVLIEGGGGAGDSVKKEVAPSNQPPLPVAEPAPDPAVEEEDAFGIAIATAADLPATPPSKQQERSIDSVTTDDDKNKNENDNQSLEGRKQKTRSCIDSTPTAAGNALVDTAPNHHEQEHERLPQAPLLEPTAMHAAASAVDALPRTTDPSETDDDKDRNPLMKAAIATTATIAVSQNSKVSSKRKQLPAGVEHTLPPPPRDTNPVEEPKINEDSERQRSVVDVHFITDTILAAASTCSSTGNQQNKRRVAGRNCPRALLDRLNQDARTMLAPKMMFHLSDTVPDNDDCDPNERGGSNASSTCRIWDHQIVHIPWQPQSQHSGKQNTTGCHFEAPPNVATLIRVCYSLSAWLEATHTHHTAAAATEVESMASSMPSSSSHHHHHNNSKTHPIAIVTCDNGQTRTTLAIACFLKFAGIVETCRAGFCHVVERRRRRQTSPSTTAFSAPYSPEAIYQALPPSIHTVFRNFDTAVDLGAYLNRKALWLDAIALQGVPVEDRPCLDVWDGTGQHVYSSDPHVWNENSPTTIESLQQSNIHDSRHSPLKPAEMSSPTLSRQMATSSQWVDEEGFFRVNCLLQGDFYIVCRFGGAHASGVLDPSKIIFRYANSTAFMGAASPYELSSSQVDIQRRYDRHIDPNDFMISLMFDAHWTLASSSTPGEAEKSLLRRDCPASILPEILSGKQAMEAGWHEIVKHHVVKPVKKNIDSLIAESLGELDGCPRHIISLSLQLANFDSTMAQTMLLEGRLRSWWQIELQPEDDESMMAAKSNGCPPRARATNIFDSLPVLTEAQTLDKVRLLLESTNLKQRNSGPRDFLLERVRQQASRTTVSAESQGVGLKDSHPSKLTGLYYTSPIMTPNPGDVVSALNSSRISTLLRGKSTPRDHPLLPMIPKRRKRSNTLPIEDPDNDSALDFLLKLNHPGVDLQDLLYVSKTIRSLHSRETPDQSITANGTASNPPNDQDPEETTDVLPVTNNQIPSEESSGLSGPTAETLVMTKSQNSGHMASTAAAAAMAKRLRPGALIAITSEIRLKGDMKIKSKTSMLSASAEAVTASLSKHETAGSSDGETVATAEMARRLNPAEEISPVADEPQRTGDAEVPLKEDPKYQKYFKMLKVGLPDGAVRNAMQRDDLDGSILDLDPSKSLKSQRTKAISPEASFDDDVPIKDDPVFQIYFKMLQMGLPDGAVRNAMARDGVDASALDLDKEKSFKSQTLSIDAVEDSGIPIKDDPAFQKYFKMMKMGLPEGAIRNAMARDGLDASVLDLDPNKSLRSQIKSDEVKDDGIPIKDDPNFQKYFKMLKMGLPHGAVRNAMDRDGADASILDLDPEKSLKSQRNGPSTVDAVDEDIPIRDDPAFQKYFKMVKMGLPEGAVRNAMDRDGVDSTVLDLDPTKSLQFQRNVLPDEDDGVPLKDDPEWSKYFKMLQMGLPLGAVKNAVERDGKQGSVLDLDPTKSIASQLKTPGKSRMVPKKKKRVRRKKIYWNPLNSGQIKANSLWSTVKGRLQMSQLKYDEKEFADLFTESADPADKKNKPEKQDTSKAKKPQQVIDGKRSMNGGIILARLKVNYKSIAEMVDNMYVFYSFHFITAILPLTPF